MDVPPIVGERGLYVLPREGIVYRLDPDNLLAEDWSVALSGAGAPFDRDMAFDPTRNLLFVVGSDSVLYAITDEGATGSNPWGQASTSLPHGLFSHVAVAPFLGQLYVTTDAGKVRQIDAVMAGGATTMAGNL